MDNNPQNIKKLDKQENPDLNYYIIINVLDVKHTHVKETQKLSTYWAGEVTFYSLPWSQCKRPPATACSEQQIMCPESPNSDRVVCRDEDPSAELWWKWICALFSR